MENAIAIRSKSQAKKVLHQHGDVVEKNDVRQTVNNALSKLNDVEMRIDQIENKGFFKRFYGGITGQNQREMVAAMRDMSEAQNMTIQLVLSLAIMHANNQRAMDAILDELALSKGTYTRITDHIDFLYSQVEHVKQSHRQTSSVLQQTKSVLKVGVMIILTVATILFLVGLF